MSDPHTNFDYPTIKLVHLLTFPLSETVTAHAPCHVTYPQDHSFGHSKKITLGPQGGGTFALSV